MSDAPARTMRSLEETPWDVVGGSSLEVWYQSIRDVPLGDLPIGDVARSCRQALFPDEVLPIAIGRLREDPMAGEQYDGELLASLRAVPDSFWRRRDDLRGELAEILAELDASGLDDALAAEVEAIRNRAGLL